MKFTTIKIAMLMGLATLFLSNGAMAVNKCRDVTIKVENTSACGVLVKRVRYIDVATGRKRVKHTANFSVSPGGNIPFGTVDLRKVEGRLIKIRVYFNGGLAASFADGDTFQCQDGATTTVTIPPGIPGCAADVLREREMIPRPAPDFLTN